MAHVDPSAAPTGAGGAEEAPATGAGAAAPLYLPAESTPLTVSAVATLAGHKERVWGVAWCPTEELLASCSGDRTVRLWARRPAPTAGDGDGDAWHCVQVLEGEHQATIRHVSWSPGGTYLAAASFDRTASVWRRAEDGDEEAGGGGFEVEGVLDGHASEVKGVAWASEDTLATCSRDQTVWVWERVDEGEYECAGVLAEHTQDVKCCLWDLGEGRRPQLLSCGYDNTVRVWSDASRRQDDWHAVQTLRQHHGTVWAAALQRMELRPELAAATAAAPPQPLLCTCSDDLQLLFWRRARPPATGAADGGEEYQWVRAATVAGVAERPVYSVDWAPAAAPVVAAACGDNSLLLLCAWEDAEGVHAGVAARVAEAHLSDVNSVSFSPFGSLAASPSSPAAATDGVLLATGGDDNLVRLWRVRSL